MDVNLFKRWLDPFRCTVELKGGYMPLHAHRFILISSCRASWLSQQHEGLYNRVEFIEFWPNNLVRQNQRDWRTIWCVVRTTIN